MRRDYDNFTMPAFDYIEGLKKDPRFESDAKFRAVSKLLSSLATLSQFGNERVLTDTSNDAIVRAIRDFESSDSPSEWANGLEAYDGLEKFWEFVQKFSETRLDTANCFEAWLISWHMCSMLNDEEFQKPRKSWNLRYTITGIETSAPEAKKCMAVLDICYFTTEMLMFMFWAFIRASCAEKDPDHGEYFSL